MAIHPTLAGPIRVLAYQNETWAWVRSAQRRQRERIGRQENPFASSENSGFTTGSRALPCRARRLSTSAANSASTALGM